MEGQFAYDESGINRFTYKLAAALVVLTLLGVAWANVDWNRNEMFCGGDALGVLEPGDPCYAGIN